MDYYPFPALLRSEYNDIEEYGSAQITREGNALNFEGEFVPLVPLGQKASIAWMLGETTLAEFSGKVYLSSAQMLQLVDVDPDKLNTARTLFSTNTDIPASLVPAASPKAPRQAAHILYLSMGLLKLLVRESPEEGMRLRLDAQVDFLSLHNLELVVRKRIVFRKEETMLLCEVEGISQENYISMSTYIAKIQNKQNK